LYRSICDICSGIMHVQGATHSHDLVQFKPPSDEKMFAHLGEGSDV